MPESRHGTRFAGQRDSRSIARAKRQGRKYLSKLTIGDLIQQAHVQAPTAGEDA